MDDQKQAAVQRVVEDPVGSVQAALDSEKPSQIQISALVFAVQEARLWAQVRDANVAKLFIRLLVDKWLPDDAEVCPSKLSYHRIPYQASQGGYSTMAAPTVGPHQHHGGDQKD